MPLPFARRKISRNVFQIDVGLAQNAQWEHRHLLLSDVHFDSIHCDRDLLKRHCDLALEQDATISCHGDLFDAMQGTADPRQSKEELRPEYAGLGKRYIHALVDDAMVFFEKYANNIVFLGDGNHETKLDKRAEISLTNLLLHDLNRKTKHEIYYGHYAGYLTYRFPSKLRRERGASGGGVCSGTNMYYHHGTGLKSKAAIHRCAMTHPRADIMAFGHHHEFAFDWIPRMDLTTKGSEPARPLLILQTAGYKSSGDMASGWAVEKGMRPHPVGAWELRFTWNRPTARVEFEPLMLK